jgi:hypothetical protein
MFGLEGDSEMARPRVGTWEQRGYAEPYSVLTAASLLAHGAAADPGRSREFRRGETRSRHLTRP